MPHPPLAKRRGESSFPSSAALPVSDAMVEDDADGADSDVGDDDGKDGDYAHVDDWTATQGSGIAMGAMCVCGYSDDNDCNERQCQEGKTKGEREIVERKKGRDREKERK